MSIYWIVTIAAVVGALAIIKGIDLAILMWKKLIAAHNDVKADEFPFPPVENKPRQWRGENGNHPLKR